MTFQCVICKTGETEKGLVTVTLNRDNSIVIIKDVPAEICQNCGEYFLDEETSSKVMAQAEDAMKRHAEVEIVRFAA